MNRTAQVLDRKERLRQQRCMLHRLLIARAVEKSGRTRAQVHAVRYSTSRVHSLPWRVRAAQVREDGAAWASVSPHPHRPNRPRANLPRRNPPDSARSVVGRSSEQLSSEHAGTRLRTNEPMPSAHAAQPAPHLPPAGLGYKLPLAPSHPRHHIISIESQSINQAKQQHHQAISSSSSSQLRLLRSAGPAGLPGTGSWEGVPRSGRTRGAGQRGDRGDMGSCFSSSGSAGDDAGEEMRRPRRGVWPSDDDGGEWDVDNRAAIYIAKFHRHQSGVVCTDCAADQQQQTPAPATAQ